MPAFFLRQTFSRRFKCFLDAKASRGHGDNPTIPHQEGGVAASDGLRAQKSFPAIFLRHRGGQVRIHHGKLGHLKPRASWTRPRSHRGNYFCEFSPSAVIRSGTLIQDTRNLSGSSRVEELGARSAVTQKNEGQEFLRGRP